MSVITIARQFGAGGRTLGNIVAERLGYTLIDEEIVEMLAREANVSSDWIDDIERKTGSESLLSRLLGRIRPLRKGYVKLAAESKQDYMDGDHYITLLRTVIPRIADQDNVVIIGRGGQFILAKRPDAFHFLLIADFTHRIGFIMEHYGLDEKQARLVLDKQSRRRLQLYRYFDRVDYERPELYHLVCNMNRLCLDDAATLICRLVPAQ